MLARSRSFAECFHDRSFGLLRTKHWLLKHLCWLRWSWPINLQFTKFTSGPPGSCKGSTYFVGHSIVASEACKSEITPWTVSAGLWYVRRHTSLSRTAFSSLYRKIIMFQYLARSKAWMSLSLVMEISRQPAGFSEFVGMISWEWCVPIHKVALGSALAFEIFASSAVRAPWKSNFWYKKRVVEYPCRITQHDWECSGSIFISNTAFIPSILKQLKFTLKVVGHLAAVPIPVWILSTEKIGS